MAGNKTVIYLDLSDIKSAIKQIDEYESKLENVIDSSMKDVSEKAEIHARFEAGQALATGELKASMYSDYDSSNKTLTVGNNCPYAVFVEFGRGVAKPGMHPLAEKFGFTRGGYGKGLGSDFSGWYYPTDENDPNPCKYTDKEGNVYGFTRGANALPFLYNSLKYIKKTLPEAIKRGMSGE